MADAVMFKVQFPAGSLKKTTTVNLKGDQTVEQALQDIIKTGRLAQPDAYLLYWPEGLPSKWLQMNKSLADIGLTAQVRPLSCATPFLLFPSRFPGH